MTARSLRKRRGAGLWEQKRKVDVALERSPAMLNWVGSYDLDLPNNFMLAAIL